MLDFHSWELHAPRFLMGLPYGNPWEPRRLTHTTGQINALLLLHTILILYYPGYQFTQYCT